MSDISKILNLRSQNACALISKLFDELLSSIFLTLIPPWSSIGYYFGPTYQLARAISQVCFRWRQLTLSLPRLWKSIELQYGTSEWKHELFRRSVDAPFIEIHSPDDESSDKIFNMSGVLPRIRFFHGDLSAKGWTQLLSSAQQLEQLSLGLTSGALQGNMAFTFHDQAPPSLQYLWMQTTEKVNLVSPIFSSLRDVTIAQDTIFAPYLASVVKNMPFLEHLTVAAVVSGANDPHPRRIPLPHLRHLSCTDHNLVKCIDLPQECTLRISCLAPEYKNVLTDFIPKFNFDHIQKGNLCLSIEFSGDQVTIHNRKPFQSEYTDCSELVIYTHGHRDSRGRLQGKRSCLPILRDVISGLASILPTITILEIVPLIFDGWNNIGPVFRHFTAVLTVSFGGSDGAELFPWLKHSYKGGSAQGPEILFPSLQTVHLPHNYQRPGRAAREFKSFLAWRIEQGAPIKRVDGQYSDGTEYTFEEEWGGFVRELESIYGVQVHMVRERYPIYTALQQNISSYLVEQTA